jgi:hypothetical protein
MIGGRKWSLFQKFNEFKTLKKDSITMSMPGKFSNLSEARDALDYHRLLASYSLTKIPRISVSSYQRAFATWKLENAFLLQQWISAFETWMNEHRDSMTEMERKGTKVLGILKNMCFVSLHITRTDGNVQTAWDVFNPQFKEAVELAEDVLLPADEFPIPTFSLDMEIVGPLYGVASRCRDPYIRRRAIRLLKSCARQEGMWNAALTGRVAQRVIEIEEEGLGEVRSCNDVPDWARISNVKPTFDRDGRKATLNYSRLKSRDVVGRKTVEEVIEW